ncbi:MAG: hypothetical protein MUC96_20970 [Myxococcaceae bacterium]|nr:hypothetical protein [Myxococcaceae bacterium]
MAHPHLETFESIVIDGPNGVTGAPRAGFPDGALSLGVGLGAVLSVAVLLRSRAPRWVVALVLLAGALPGLGALGWLRADAPHRRAALASSVTAGLADLARLAPGPVARTLTVRDDGDVLFPLARYTWPARIDVDGGVLVDLHGSSLTTACRAEPSGLVVSCGAPP